MSNKIYLKFIFSSVKITTNRKQTFISCLAKNDDFGKSWFTATMEVTIHQKKNNHITCHEKIKQAITNHKNARYHRLL